MMPEYLFCQKGKKMKKKYGTFNITFNNDHLCLAKLEKRLELLSYYNVDS